MRVGYLTATCGKAGRLLLLSLGLEGLPEGGGGPRRGAMGGAMGGVVGVAR